MDFLRFANFAPTTVLSIICSSSLLSLSYGEISNGKNDGARYDPDFVINKLIAIAQRPIDISRLEAHYDVTISEPAWTNAEIDEFVNDMVADRGLSGAELDDLIKVQREYTVAAHSGIRLFKNKIYILDKLHRIEQSEVLSNPKLHTTRKAFIDVQRTDYSPYSGWSISETLGNISAVVYEKDALPNFEKDMFYYARTVHPQEFFNLFILLVRKDQIIANNKIKKLNEITLDKKKIKDLAQNQYPDVDFIFKNAPSPIASFKIVGKNDYIIIEYEFINQSLDGLTRTTIRSSESKLLYEAVRTGNLGYGFPENYTVEKLDGSGTLTKRELRIGYINVNPAFTEKDKFNYNFPDDYMVSILNSKGELRLIQAATFGGKMPSAQFRSVNGKTQTKTSNRNVTKWTLFTAISLVTAVTVIYIIKNRS